MTTTTELTHATATPFQKAGYTKDTKFIVLVDEPGYGIEVGQIVWLHDDDGSDMPEFTNGTGIRYFSIREEDAELKALPNVVSIQPSPTIAITHNLTIKGHTHVLTTEEVAEVLNGLIDSLIVLEDGHQG